MPVLVLVPNVDDMTQDSARKRRLAIFGGVVLVAIVAVAAIIGLSSGGSSSSTTSSASLAASNGTGLKDTTQIEGLFEGIPQKGNTLGSPNAPATMVIFADLQCPFCAEFENTAMPAIVKKYVRTGKLKLVFHPIVIVGQDSVLGARASAAAAAQNKMYNFNGVLYHNQGQENSGYLNVDFVKKVALGAGLNPDTIVPKLNSPQVGKLLNDAQSAATSAKVSSTPAFFMAKKGQPLEQFQPNALDAAAFYGKLDQLTS